MKNKSTRHPNRRNGTDRRFSISRVLTLAIAGLTPTAGNAYTAAGDRNFPATLILPQVAPSDAFWGNIGTLPMANGQQTKFTGTYSKLITEQLGIQFQGGITRKASVNSAQKFNVLLQDEVLVDQPHEFLFSVEVGHGFGAQTFPPSPSTTPAVTLPKDWATSRSAIGARSRSLALPGIRSPKGRGPTCSRPASPSNIRYRISCRRWRMLTCPHSSAE